MGPIWNADLFTAFKNSEYEQRPALADLGDENLVYQKRKRQSSGQYYLYYYIEFRYRNVWAQVLGQGLEANVPPAYLENLARLTLDKLQAAPLAAP